MQVDFSGSGYLTFNSVAYNVLSFNGNDPGHVYLFANAGFGIEAVPESGVFTIGTSAPLVSTVPLPASAPMFGAALMALGAVSYGLKRKLKAAAA